MGKDISENFLKKKCTICSCESFFIKKINNFNINKCLGCGLEFTYPMPTTECLEHFYYKFSDFRAHEEVTKKNALRNFNFLQENFALSPNFNILDYGCGNNMFVEICREKNFVNSFGYDQHIDEIDDKRISLSSCLKKKWDMITLWGVLEHLTSPVKTVLNLKKLLSENGIIALTTINIEGKIPFQYKPPEHTHYFTERSLQELSKAAGLSILSFDDYRMEQYSEVYLSILLRTMPDKYKKLVSHNMPEFVEIPTNEVRLVLGVNNK